MGPEKDWSLEVHKEYKNLWSKVESSCAKEGSFINEKQKLMFLSLQSYIRGSLLFSQYWHFNKIGSPDEIVKKVLNQHIIKKEKRTYEELTLEQSFSRLNVGPSFDHDLRQLRDNLNDIHI